MLFIDALDQVTRERAQSFLKPEHQDRILVAYRAFSDEDGFAKVADQAAVAANGNSLSIPLYVKRLSVEVMDANDDAVTLKSAWAKWEAESQPFWQQMDAVFETLDGLAVEEAGDA